MMGHQPNNSMQRAALRAAADAERWIGNDMTDPSRDIPLPVRRRLRQEAGFGCCLCGNPIIEYHHIRPIGRHQVHDPDHMMTLCPLHHHEATVGGLAEEEQRRSKNDPENIRRGYTEGLLRITEPGIAVHAATNDFVGAGFKLVVDNHPLLALDSSETGRLELSIDLYDLGNHLLLSVAENEWIAGDPLPWDIEFGVRWLTIRRGHGDVALRLDARHSPVTLAGRLCMNGQRFDLESTGLYFNGALKSIGVVELGLVGLGIHVDTRAGSFQLKPDPRLGSAVIVSCPEREARLRKCFEALEQLERNALDGRTVKHQAQRGGLAQ